MILLSDDPREPRNRQRLIDLLGAEDAGVLVRWVHETHRAQGIAFGDALQTIADETDARGPQFARNLLDVARKPKHVRDAEVEILSWVKPRVDRAIAVVMGHRGNADVAREQYGLFIEELRAYLNRNYKRHQATIDGAIMTGCSHNNGQFEVRVHQIVAALDLKDPMSAFYARE